MPESSPVSTRVSLQGSATESWTVILLWKRVLEGDVGGVEEVVGEVLLDDVALVPQADDEFIDALLGVELEDVPKAMELRPAYFEFMGLGRTVFSWLRREARPPARMTAFFLPRV